MARVAIVPIVMASGVAFALPALAGPSAWKAGDLIPGTVKQIYDGDGLWLEDGDGNPNTFLQIRLFGINAPEWNHFGGKEAKEFLVGRIKGQHVRCTVRDIDRKYSRPVSICLDDAGNDLSCAIVWAGHAVVTNAKYVPCDRSKLPPPGPAPF